MLSRTADHLFWMSRNTERAEKAAARGISPQLCLGLSSVRGLLPAHAKKTTVLRRTAVHLFWMSRCTERAEKAAAGGLSPQHRVRAQRVRGSLPAHAKENAC